MPILANVLLAAKGDQLAITATDLEVELVASTKVNRSRAAKSRFRAAKCSTSARIAGGRDDNDRARR